MATQTPTKPGWYRARMLTPDEPTHWIFAEVVDHKGELRMLYHGGNYSLAMPEEWGEKVDPCPPWPQDRREHPNAGEMLARSRASGQA